MPLYTVRTYDAAGRHEMVYGLKGHYNAPSPEEALKRAMVELAKEYYEPSENQGFYSVAFRNVHQMNVYETPWWPRKRPEHVLKGPEFERALQEAKVEAAVWHRDLEDARRSRSEQRQAKKETRLNEWEQEGTRTDWPGLSERPALSSLDTAAASPGSPEAERRPSQGIEH